MPELPLPENLHEEPTDGIAHLDQGNDNGNPPDAEAPGATFVPNVADLRTSLELLMPSKRPHSITEVSMKTSWNGCATR